MTVGEKIQYYRKEKQLSQEDLGRLLMVSRQTVSLWENDQTLPTIDNLMRLKEIFGVSIDTILTEESIQKEVPSNEPPLKANESYCFTLNKNELKYLHSIFTSPLLKQVFLWIFLFILTLCFSFNGAALLVLIFFVISLIRYIYGASAVKKNLNQVLSRKYVYEVFYDHICARIFNNTEEIRSQKIYFGEFTKCWETPFCYFLELSDRTTFIIKKSVLLENSYLHYFCQNFRTEKTDLRSEKIVFLKAAGKFLFAGCFLSFFLAISTAFNSMPDSPISTEEAMENLTAFHWFLPVPVLSVVVGILLNKNKIRNKKNIVCGIIIGAIMLIYGFFPAIFSDISDNLDYLEAQLGFELPEYEGMNYQTVSNLGESPQAITMLSFNESVANEFEEFIATDSRWLNGSGEYFSCVLPDMDEGFPTDYCLIFNSDNGQFSKLPKNDGEYQYIYIAYSTEMNVAYIYEYTVDYKK